MRSSRSLIVLSAVLAVAACTTDPTSNEPQALREPTGLAPARSTSTSNPTATWLFPLSDAGLAIKSDQKYPDATGTYSQYANGVCSFASTIIYSGSGDNTFSFSYPKSKSCGRTWTVTYSDGVAETLAYNGGVQVLESTSFTIPVGTTALRHFRIGTSTTGSNANSDPVPSRCSQGLVFGPNGGNPAPGSDSVRVTRVDARTWDVSSQPDTVAADGVTVIKRDHAYCINNGQLYDMPMSFRIVASQNLP